MAKQLSVNECEIFVWKIRKIYESVGTHLKNVLFWNEMMKIKNV
nr:hypothetical protein [Mycoplasmopsis bovis]